MSKLGSEEFQSLKGNYNEEVMECAEVRRLSRVVYDPLSSANTFRQDDTAVRRAQR